MAKGEIMRGKLRWGILGTAAIAPAVIDGIRRTTNGVVGAVASRDLARGRSWAAAYGVPQAFGSYDALVKSGVVDVVYNPLPNSLHAEWTLRSLEAGLPVLCEKPLAASAAEARLVAAASQKTGLPAAEAFMYRFHPIYDAVLARIREGAIGDVRCVQSTFTWYLDDRTQIPASAELAGGALMDVGCYPVNLARLITGAEPDSVAAFQHGGEVDDTLVGVLRFPNGVLAEIECSIEGYERARAEIVGTRGSIVLESPWHPGDEGARFIVRHDGRDETVVTPGANRYQLEAQDFADAVLTGRPPRWPIEDAVANMAVIDALLTSARTGAVVPVAGA
jgi:xylose dehydrogenase (NAD/NADP)